eukprot:CAMPEP_0172838684 /NCGR_PEP_ID=MMETSP1075-20121228/28043_1 /TAXON_ID=2916 /ORGANISM="Ceratium fusus, Strain PA161109" /LENGTH=114 /DNA_ID=CAMNT_0013682227 /DNA_START=351 /DNA_END=696 /DNA_ORIENTATION=-
MGGWLTRAAACFMACRLPDAKALASAFSAAAPLRQHMMDQLSMHQMPLEGHLGHMLQRAEICPPMCSFQGQDRHEEQSGPDGYMQLQRSLATFQATFVKAPSRSQVARESTQPR